MSTSLPKLQKLLQKLFRADTADLNRGIYRIINLRRDRLQTFIDDELPKRVNEVLDANPEIESAYQELENLANQIRNDLGEGVLDAGGTLISNHYNNTPLVKKYRGAQAQEGTARGREERQEAVYNHLYTFFSRYYDNGDFIPRRRYSRSEKYAVPYNGEEVYLHWANRDQYYVKSSEYFSVYGFEKAGIKVIFDLKIANVEKDNVKGENRFFIPLSAETDYNPENNEVRIPFEYRPLTNDEKSKYGKQKQQDKIVDAAESEILQAVTSHYDVLSMLGQEINGVSVLKQHLGTYTRGYTADYFIHKNLKAFLTGELDVYIKNEVMPVSSFIFVEDISDAAQITDAYWVETARLVYSIATQVIDFLSQIEEFQKSLWLKKKFVLSTDYCLTLDLVPEVLYTKITENAAQLAEWKDLFAIHEANYSEPLPVEFLKDNSNLVLDTRHFDSDFKDRLLAHFDDLDNKIDGLLIHGENFQALNLLTKKYRESIKCIHIDPPYNTQAIGFLYKNTYQHSSWLSMMADRLTLAEQLMAADSCILCHIDENEYENLFQIFSTLPLKDQGTLVWDKRNPVFGTSTIATQHEYIITQSKGNIKLLARSLNRTKILREAASLMKKHGGVSEECRQEFSAWVKHKPELSGGERAYSEIDDDGRVYRAVSMAAPAQETGAINTEPLIHPDTHKPCRVPANGWSRKPETMRELLDKGLILFGRNEKKIPEHKILLEDYLYGELSSLIPCGEKGKTTIDALGLSFPYCHPVSLYEELTWAAIPDSDDITLDFFAGSGTSAHATISLNRRDDGNRKYILVEMGEYFESVLKPRVKKAVYAEKWKAGKPVSRDSRLSHMFKYQRLESYEDALNSIEFTEQESSPFDAELLSYLLGTETLESPTLLNIEQLQSPFSYKLTIVKDMRPESQSVDLPETFNYLLGITVATRQCLYDKDRRYLIYRGIVGEKPVVIIWRDTSAWTDTDWERDYQFIQEQQLTADASDIYVNTHSIIPEAKSLDPIFKQLMFPH